MKNKNKFGEWLKEPRSLFTKRLYNPKNPGDFATVIRGTSILHGKFFATDEHGWKIWGANRFGKRDGLIVTFIEDKDMMFLKNYRKGNCSKLLTAIRGYNTHGIPYYETTMNGSWDPTEENGTYHDVTTYCVTKIDDTECQRILVKKTNTAVDGRAIPRTIENIYEPRIGGPTFPAVINIFKDLELGKLYTLWMRPDKSDGNYRIIAAARSSVEPNDSCELGYESHFDEIMILSKPHPIGEYPENDPGAFAAFVDVTYYEDLKREDGCEGLFVSFEKTDDGHINHAVMKVTDEESNDEKEIKTTITEAEVDLLLFDLQRGSGTGIAEVRASILAHDDCSGQTEISGSCPEDVQRSGEEASCVSDGDEVRIDSPDNDQA